MIQLYCQPDCPDCTDIETALQEMVVAHKVIVVEAGQPTADLGPNISLPAIKDNGQTITGAEAISTYLKELQIFVTNWQKFQSDSCYISDEGQTC